MKRTSCVVAAIVLLTGQACAEPTDWTNLKKFVGTYPTIDLKKSPIVRHEINELLTPNQRARLAKMTVSPQVTIIAGDLLAQFCTPHDCGSQSAVLIIDPSLKKLWFGVYANNGKKVEMDWTGTNDPADIPVEMQRQFAKIHSPF